MDIIFVCVGFVCCRPHTDTGAYGARTNRKYGMQTGAHLKAQPHHHRPLLCLLLSACCLCVCLLLARRRLLRVFRYYFSLLLLFVVCASVCVCVCACLIILDLFCFWDGVRRILRTYMRLMPLVYLRLLGFVRYLQKQQN